jgi:CheY-like chemotaxis protein/HPt (histidine-containing phosphotransfer) domain-containing protein
LSETQNVTRILVAEDAPVNLLLIRSYLKDPSFAVDVAPNGAVAVDKFQSGVYDLVLMDLQMPVMDGYTATEKIRAWEVEHQKQPTPILALTAHAFEEEKQASHAAGCNAHLVKPIRKAELLEAIQTHIRAQAPWNGKSQRIAIRPPEGIEEAVPLFLESTREDLRALSQALEIPDYSKIRFIGHDLKGSGGGYGFDKISVIGRSIEEAAKRSDAEEVGKQIAALADYLDRVDVVLE